MVKIFLDEINFINIIVHVILFKRKSVSKIPIIFRWGIKLFIFLLNFFLSLKFEVIKYILR